MMFAQHVGMLVGPGGGLQGEFAWALYGSCRMGTGLPWGCAVGDGEGLTAVTRMPGVEGVQRDHLYHS